MSSTSAAAVPLSSRPAWYRDRFALGVAGAFCALATLCVADHVMWRDEWPAFLTGRFATSLGEVFQESRVNGQPFFWYFSAWLLGKLPGYPWPLKIFHILISTTTTFLLVRTMPLARWQRVMLVFGYFLFYEYAVMVREHGPALLAIVVASVAFIQPQRRPILFGLALAAVFQMSLFNLAIGAALGLAYLFDVWRTRGTAGAKASAGGLLIGGAIAAASLALTCWHVWPPADAVNPYLNAANFTSPERLPWAMSSVWRGCVPLRMAGLWNTNFLDFAMPAEVAVSWLLVAAVAVLSVRRPTALVFYLLATVGVLATCVLIGPAQTRHQGQVFTVFVLTILMWFRTRESDFLGLARRWPRDVWIRWRKTFVTAILGIQVAAMALAVTDERIRPLSGAKEAAEIIRQQVPPDLPVIGDTDNAMMALAGYLDRPVYVACRQEFGTFLKRDAKRGLEPLEGEELRRRVVAFSLAQGRDVLLVVNYTVENPETQPMQVGKVWATIVMDERYEVYRIPYLAGAPAPPAAP